jgi:hypothetical protein
MDISSLTEHNWNADVEKKNTQVSTKPPQAILDMPKPVPSRVPLNDEQLNDAKKDLLNKQFVKLRYPREQKFRVDPTIPGQHIGLISFVPSQNATPDQEGCFGVLKFRGAFSNSNEAETYAETLLRDHDTYATIDLVHIGKEFPLLVDNTMYTAATREIDIRKKVDEVVKADLKQKKAKEQKEIDEVTARQQKLLDKTHEAEKEQIYDDIDYYTTLRVKKAQALSLIDEAKKRMEEGEAVVESTNKEIDELDILHPEYKNDFVAKYENALLSTGTKIEDNPLIKYLK